LCHKRKKAPPSTLVAIVPAVLIEHAFVHDDASPSGSLACFRVSLQRREPLRYGFLDGVVSAPED
jgi:hypothetical protein